MKNKYVIPVKTRFTGITTNKTSHSQRNENVYIQSNTYIFTKD